MEPTEQEKLELEKSKLRAEIKKAEKDLEKTLRDLETYDERLILDRKRVKNDKARFIWETVRLLGVAIVTGAISYITTRTTKEREINEAHIHKQTDRFYQKMNELKEAKSELEKCQMACSLFRKYNAAGLPDIAIDLQDLDTLCKKSDLLISNVTAGENATKEAQRKNTSQRDKGKMDTVERELNNMGQLVASNTASEEQKQRYQLLQDSLNKLISSIGIQDVSEKSDEASKEFIKNLTDTKKITESISKDPSSPRMLEGFPKTGWFKEGFFLAFDGIKVFLDDLNPGEELAVIDVCKVVSNVRCSGDDRLKKGVLSKAQVIRFDHEGFDYIIRLDRIGSAGKNPFTKAAYISFEKYAK